MKKAKPKIKKTKPRKRKPPVPLPATCNFVIAPCDCDEPCGCVHLYMETPSGAKIAEMLHPALTMPNTCAQLMTNAFDAFQKRLEKKP